MKFLDQTAISDMIQKICRTLKKMLDIDAAS